jgi:hypothetical protein
VFGPAWLIYIAKSAHEDSTDAGHELVDALYGNLRHRVDPVAFDFGDLKDHELPEDGAALRRVLRGRSVLENSGLYATTIMPGDFFESWRKSDPPGSIWLNLTPACYTIRDREASKKAGADVRLHLVRGLPEPVLGSQAPDKLRSKRQKETRSATVDVLHGGKAYKFDFGSLQTFSWATVGRHRLGRLLPPYITDVQHRHATFLTSEGLPAVLPGMYRESAPQAAT